MKPVMVLALALLCGCSGNVETVPDVDSAGGTQNQPVEPTADGQEVPAAVTCETFFLDADNDGFGSDVSVEVCAPVPHPPEKPAGYSFNGGDCYDLSNLAYPGSRHSSESDRGDGSFDFDCDGVETLQLVKYSQCPDAAASGWSPGAIPNCGADNDWIGIDSSGGQLSCLAPSRKWQVCR